MGILIESRDVTGHLYRFVGNGIGAITVDAFYEQYMEMKNRSQRLKGHDIDLNEARSIIERTKKFGFIDTRKHEGAIDFIITKSGYDLIYNFGPVPTGLMKTYINQNNYIPIMISIAALILSAFALVKK